MGNMKKNVMWLVRDARGLTTYEKAFLFVVASRGLAKTYRTTLMNDMACSTGQLSNVVRTLKEKDLINIYPGFWKDGKKSQTAYTVKADVLATYVPERSPHELGSSLSEQGRSPDELGSSHSGGYKETGKETMKETEKVTKKAPVSADATTDTSSNDEIRDEYEYLGSFNVEDFEDLGGTYGAVSFDYFANTEGMRVYKSKEVNHWAVLRPWEKKFIKDNSPEDKWREAAEAYQTIAKGNCAQEKIENALELVGVVYEAW